jgi:hypothetical protein
MLFKRFFNALDNIIKIQIFMLGYVIRLYF